MPQAGKIWAQSDSMSVDAILEDVSVAKTIVWCKNINPNTSIFQFSKNYGNPTNIT